MERGAPNDFWYGSGAYFDKMKESSHFRYIGTPDQMNEKEAYSCKKYIKSHRESMKRVGNLLIDLPALLTPFHLDCGNCRHVHHETCCEGGQPYALENKQADLLEKMSGAIANQFWSESAQRKLAAEGIWDKHFGVGTIRMDHSNCLFYKEINGSYGCSIHAYAQKAGMDVVPLKPFSCQLYPLELIDTGDMVLVTALTGETAAFSRWGTDYLQHFYCASMDRRKAAQHLDAELFALDGYKPAYQWNLLLLQAYLGENAAELLDLLGSQEKKLDALQSLDQ
ncbi:DUF3109 family protein [Brevibacillus ruminantium]|uniref:DUF3109 family protein n=1 Tax=Brevibacillus ruminantium TaxID=2950604 RepID=A0ABY4WDE5_9BACL|nr:DUF3109 family protein [Brevibacillus ruminantium]USG63790.1 DUF3109 family protein [Brevibacillus ruminantium]